MLILSAILRFFNTKNKTKSFSNEMIDCTSAEHACVDTML